jgi:TolB-like protein/Tfp pilus assembly protein PilF
MDGAGELARGVLPPRTAPLRFAAFTLDLDGCTLSREDGVEIPLTRNEFALLREFVRHPGRVLSRDYLLDVLAGKRADPFDRSVDVLVGRLRRKIEPDAKQPTLILTVAGEGYKLATPVGGAAARSAAALAVSALLPDKTGPPRLSIVVLPLANMSGDPEQDYFVDGVTESLTTDLSRMRACLVIGRNTAFTYKGNAVDLREIGRELNVRYVLEGSVQRARDQMRISVQLIDAESGNHLWAERFDKTLGDLFRIQDEIVARLANQLGAELASAEARRSRSAPNPDSFDLVCQGWACNYKGPTLENLSQARMFFERALALDPQNVEALVQTAVVDFQFAEYLFSEDRTSRLARAEAALLEAIRLAPDHAGAHLSLGPVLCVTGRGWEAIAECERALAIDQNLAAAHGAIAAFKIHVGRPEETEAHVREALRLSPRDSAVFHWLMFVGGANLVLGRYEEAIEWLERSIKANRNNPLCHFHLAGTFAGLGRLEEAKAAARAGLALNPQFTVARFRAASAGYHADQAARHERFAEALRKAGVPEG